MQSTRTQTPATAIAPAPGAHPSHNDDVVRMVGRAIAQNSLKFAFQPVVSAKRTGTVAFHECLVRIEDADGKTIPAGDFIPAVEGHEVGRMLDRAVLRHVLTLIDAHPVRRISLNLSANGIGDQTWLGILRDACAANPLCGELLIVEVTESAFLDLNADALDFLFELRNLGCSVAIDDFGAGHTSIGHLGKFRFDFLKIDKSFMADFSADPSAQYLVSSMIGIAKHFDMVTVIEGVEDMTTARHLRTMGADCLQGFAIGRPEIRDDWAPVTERVAN